MDRFEMKFHVRFANFRNCRFDDRILNEVQLKRLSNNADIEVLYVVNLNKSKGEVK